MLGRNSGGPASLDGLPDLHQSLSLVLLPSPKVLVHPSPVDCVLISVFGSIIFSFRLSSES